MRQASKRIPEREQFLSRHSTSQLSPRLLRFSFVRSAPIVADALRAERLSHMCDTCVRFCPPR